jgi:succinoglycan biosynthesis protein ExoV
MELNFFRGKHPNFGDELNTWLLPKVFPNFFDEDDRTLFLGIGSILYDHEPEDSQKIVFGSGYAGYRPLPKFDDKWTIYCVRGPRTAEACGLSQDKVAGDAAILINLYRKRRQPPSLRRVAFMPHFESLDYGNWQSACRLAGIHFIDPRHPVEKVLAEIEASSVLIAEAMHGAIVADALRVPWIPALPLHASHRFKWFDWAGALDLKLSPHPLWPSSTQEASIVIRQRRAYRLENPRGAIAAGVRCVDAALTMLAATRLWQMARMEPMLSSNAALNRVLDKLETHAEQIKRDFAGREDFQAALS